MTEVGKAKVLEVATAELRSAYTLVADPQCDPRTAMPHLRHAWRSIAWLSTGAMPEDEGEAELDAWLSAEHLALIPTGRRAEVLGLIRTAHAVSAQPEVWDASADDAVSLPSSRVLLRHLRLLDKLVVATREQQLGRPLKLQTAARWGLRGFVALASVAAFVLVALRPWQGEDIGPWRGAYYPSKKFEGDPDLRRHVDVAFDWGVEPPTESIPADNFTARFDSCLILDEDAEVAFMLVSDDGSRLFIDGDRVIDGWKKRSSSARGRRTTLAAGVHHVRVEYFEKSHKAKLHLTASFDPATPPAPIPAQMLEFPGMDFDEDDPCAGKS